MAEPFLAEIRMFTSTYPPKGWAACDGQRLPINQNQALYSLIGTMYGGDGHTTFALPDLRNRAPRHVGNLRLGAVDTPCATANNATADHLALQFCIALQGIFPSQD